MDDERQGVVTGLKTVILRQKGSTRRGRRDGGICTAVELKVVCDGPFGDTG
jgi:hypothetical protein